MSETQDITWAQLGDPYIASIYWAFTTISTVGYGDIHPTSAGTRVATVLLAFVGITLIFSQVAWAMANAFMPAAQWMRSKLEAWHPPEVVKVEGLDGHSTEIRVPSAAGLYYVLNLAPVVGLWLALQLLFAGVLCVAQPMGYLLALYHILITSTTVGLGDVQIETDAAKVVVVLHIFVSVGTLSTVFQEASK